MEFEPSEYERRIFSVKAEEVTYENIEAVAKWCKGRIDSESTKVLGGGEVKLPVIKFPGQGADRGKELVARLGYFVVYSKGRFRVYKEPQFHAAFEKKNSNRKVIEATHQLLDSGTLTLEDHREDQAEAAQEKEDALHAAGQL